MDKTAFIPSLLLGLIFVAFYALRCYQNGYEFNLNIVVNSVLQASGIVCGVLLLASTVYEQLKTLIEGLDLYIAISGLAVLSVSAQSFYKDVIKGTKNRNSSK